MQGQLMIKNELVLGDSLQTHQDGINSPLNSIQLKNTLNNSSRIQKYDQGTITDQMICNCACDTIPKLKQKAHKSFMQVIQIQSLFKEEIQDLKKFYEESMKNKEKKFKIKEDVLNQKCKELQWQVQKIKQHYHRQRPYYFEKSLDSPFDLDNIESIHQAPLPDESSQSIYNIRQFVLTPNLKDNAKKLENDTNNIIEALKKFKQLEGNNHNRNLQTYGDACASVPIVTQQQILRNLENQIAKIFEFIDKMIENTVQAHQKYNDLVQICHQAQNRCTKLYNQNQTQQKQMKFMADHVRRISQDKIRMEKKNNELDRLNKNLEQNIKILKKALSEKEVIMPSQKFRKDIDIFSSYNFIEDEEVNISKGSLLSTNTAKRNTGMTKSAQQGQFLQKILPKSLNFKKKSADKLPKFQPKG